MSGPWDAKYTDEQKEACALARIDGGRTARRVAEMAAAGELRLKGEPVGVFDISPNYVNQLGQKLKRDRSGKTASKVAELPHHDGVEVMRRRLMAGADLMMAAWEKAAEKHPEKADTERHRQITRCVLEASKLPGPGDPRTTPHTAIDPATGKRGTETRGGLAGALLKDHRAEAAQETQHHTNGDGDSGAAPSAARSNGASEHAEPGSLPSEQLDAPSTLPVVV
jgi:hypothetical protein